MGQIVNLRTARKRALRQKEERRAAANRLAHGRSNTERKLDAARVQKTRHDLDAHRIDPGDER
ncbi:MAG TPA: DUF4169 family protein [Pseudolabrys sp.]|nr:DUF4169 family protein [Pseudolabrys sp.]